MLVMHLQRVKCPDAGALVGRQLQHGGNASAFAGVGARVAVQHAPRHAARQLRRLQLGRVVQPHLLGGQ